jgi:hypothetical protein
MLMVLQGAIPPTVHMDGTVAFALTVACNDWKSDDLLCDVKNIAVYRGGHIAGGLLVMLNGETSLPVQI